MHEDGEVFCMATQDFEWSGVWRLEWFANSIGTDEDMGAVM